MPDPRSVRTDITDTTLTPVLLTDITVLTGSWTECSSVPARGTGGAGVTDIGAEAGAGEAGIGVVPATGAAAAGTVAQAGAIVAATAVATGMAIPAVGTRAADFVEVLFAEAVGSMAEAASTAEAEADSMVVVDSMVVAGTVAGIANA